MKLATTGNCFTAGILCAVLFQPLYYVAKDWVKECSTSQDMLSPKSKSKLSSWLDERSKGKAQAKAPAKATKAKPKAPRVIYEGDIMIDGYQEEKLDRHYEADRRALARQLAIR